MTLYRSKPQTVEAIQWRGDNWEEALSFGGPDAKLAATSDMDDFLPLQLLAGKDGAQGWVHVPIGHWLVNLPGDKSDIWPVEDAYFRAKYEIIPPTAKELMAREQEYWRTATEPLRFSSTGAEPQR